ncbi:lysylphosphatidylglycerol synthase transmembrane domain-containing protein [Lolliginicoccus levis]|uniref:lysylphosphatidylglycerol synthase transmembrane domain-containing protein n=1 Tax=Lolliginicoccus levis TaxID=2919542 RepID=UPI00241E4373|nr:lysylphosphatidylglycerol synthase transmembrane domain-containing protein [Lolliginicoccus levis]
MRVKGREIPVAGNLLQPRSRRTTDILRVVASVALIAVVIAASEVTRNKWHDLERSVSNIVGVLSPEQANLVYLLYGLVILALPFAILIGVLASTQWKLVVAYFLAGNVAGLLLSITPQGLTTSRLSFEGAAELELNSFLSQFLIDSRWIAGLAAVLTVAGPWLPKLWRRWWWALLLAFIPIHLVVSTVVPARTVLGLAVGWFVGSVTVLLVGTPALEVPLATAARVLARHGHATSRFTVLRPAGTGPLVLSSTGSDPDDEVIVELYGPYQGSSRALRQVWRWLSFREEETAPLHASLQRAVEHRALMGIAIDDLELASSRPLVVAALDRGWVLYSRTRMRGTPLEQVVDEQSVASAWHSLRLLHESRIAHGDLRASQIRVEGGAALFGGFGAAEFGVTEQQLYSDIAQLLITTTALAGEQVAVRCAIAEMGAQQVLAASSRLTRAAIPLGLRRSAQDASSVMASAREEILRQTGADQIKPEQVTRFTRNQAIQLVLLVALVYVAYPFISAVPTFYEQLRTVDWGWAVIGLAVSALTYIGAAAALWACANGLVSFRSLTVMQIANTFAATTTPAGVGGLALSVRFLQKGGLGGVRATAAVALQQSVQVITHVSLLVLFAVVAGTTAQIQQIVPDPTIIYLIIGAALGIVGTSMLVPALRRWLGREILPQLRDVAGELSDLARDPQRFGIIFLGSAMTTLGMALALWASVEAFGGGTTFVTVTVVTMVGGTLASAAPTPGGVGAVEAVLIGGLVAFGLPAATAVPAVLLYRVLTTWLPVFLGWPTMHWLTAKGMV